MSYEQKKPTIHWVDASELSYLRACDPLLSVTNAGCFRLNRALVAQLGISSDSLEVKSGLAKVLLGQDIENPKDWYISKADWRAEEGFVLRASDSKHDVGSCFFNSAPLKNLLFASLKAETAKRASFPVAREGDGGVFAIITAAESKRRVKNE